MSGQTRLLHLCEFAPREPGSFIFMLASVLAAAKGEGWDASAVFLANSRGSAWEQVFADAGVGLEFAPEGGVSELTKWLGERVDDDDVPTVLHTHFHDFDIPTARVARRRQAPTAVIWHVHSTMPTELYWRARNLVKFGIWGRQVDAYLCPAQNIVDDLRARLAPRERVRLMPSAIDVKRFPLASAEERSQARADLEIDPDAAVLLHFGWHWHLKGGDIFLDTVEELIARGHENLIGLERGGDETAQEEINRRGLGEVVRYIPVLPSITPLFRAADLLASSSRIEGMAYTVLESLCTGTAVVATDIPGHRFIGDEVEACRITRADPPLLADAIEATLERSAADRDAERDAAHRWIEENLSLEVIAKRTLSVYRECLAAPVNG